MRTLGEVIMIAAAWALVAVGVVLAIRYPWPDRPLRQFLRSGDGPFRSPYPRFVGEHSAWTVIRPLILALGVGWVLRHYG